MDPATIKEVFQQLTSDKDVPCAKRLLTGISQANASKRLPGHPYSIIENLAHAVFWQDEWLGKIRGQKGRSFMEDWKTPAPSEFKDLALKFQANQAAAMNAASKNLSSKHASLLVSMAIHDAYHMGQINLIKRSLRAK